MILKELSEAIGISSQESAVRKIVLEAIDGHAENIRIDALGGVTAIKPGTNGSDHPRIMLAAHMDEIGFMVKGVDGDGLIRFANIGGVDARMPARTHRIEYDEVAIRSAADHIGALELQLDAAACDRQQACHRPVFGGYPPLC